MFRSAFRIAFIFLFTLAGTTYAAAGEEVTHAVFLIYEHEYDTKRTVPEFAEKELAEKLGWKCTYLFGDGEHTIPGTEVLEDADVLFVSLRRQVLPANQLNDIKAYVTAGKPVVGIRTASHAFSARAKSPSNGVEWTKFDELVLGGNYHAHYDNKNPKSPRTYIWSTPEAGKHPIMEGVSIEKRVTTSWLYQVMPLAETATPIMWGQYMENPPEPVAWTNTSTFGGSVFYTSLGHQDDFESEDFRRMLSNGIRWVVNDLSNTEHQAQSN